MSEHILALDLGTTSIRAMVVDAAAQPRSMSTRTNSLHYPGPGLIEQDPEDLWGKIVQAWQEALHEAQLQPGDICSIGITAQRSSLLIWDRQTLAPLTPIVSWQDLRGIKRAEELRERGQYVIHQQAASKLEAAIDSIANGRQRMNAGELAWGNVDTFAIARLTGGATHAMDLSQLSASGYFNYVGGLNEGLILEQGLDPSTFPRITDTSQDYGLTTAEAFGAEVMIGASIADQQSAMIAQGCTYVGQGKVTYGTSGTLDVNTGAEPKFSGGCYPMVLRNQGERIDYLLEGMVITAGAMFDWMSSGLGLMQNVHGTAALAATVPDSGGAFVLPALQGLGAPHGNPDQRALIGGLSRATTKAHVMRAAMEGVACRVREAMEQICTDVPELGRQDSLRVDGGASQNDVLMQVQANVLGIPVERHAVTEATALGAALCAGETAGHWDSNFGAELRRVDRVFEPQWSEDQREEFFTNWRRATVFES